MVGWSSFQGQKLSERILFPKVLQLYKIDTLRLSLIKYLMHVIPCGQGILYLLVWIGV